MYFTHSVVFEYSVLKLNTILQHTFCRPMHQQILNYSYVFDSVDSIEVHFTI